DDAPTPALPPVALPPPPTAPAAPVTVASHVGSAAGGPTANAIEVPSLHPTSEPPAVSLLSETTAIVRGPSGERQATRGARLLAFAVGAVVVVAAAVLAMAYFAR